MLYALQKSARTGYWLALTVAVQVLYVVLVRELKIVVFTDTVALVFELVC